MISLQLLITPPHEFRYPHQRIISAVSGNYPHWYHGILDTQELPYPEGYDQQTETPDNNPSVEVK